MNDEITEVYINQEDIEFIIDKIKYFDFETLIKTQHFYYSVEEKATNMDLKYF